MTLVDLFLLSGAALAAVCNLWRPRALAWIGVVAASYAISTSYWRTAFPYPEAIGALCDTGVVLCIYFWGRHRWEMWVWRLFQFSVLVNILYLASRLGVLQRFGLEQIDHELYAIALEAINWLFLLWIGTTGILEGIEAVNEHAGRPRRGLHPLVRALQRERAQLPFHHRSK